MPLPYNALVVVRRGGILPALDEFMNNVFRAGRIRPLQNRYENKIPGAKLRRG